MKTLREKQSKFVKMIALLLQFAELRGYEITFGEATREDKRGHMPHSLHYQRLAFDLNLFRNNKYLTSSSEHRELGEFWEFIGGSWGGNFGDGNHYSLEHHGRR